jgi:uncharacterized protein YjcR
MVKRQHTGHRCGESHQRVKASDDTVWMARSMYEQGFTMAHIARKLGHPYFTVRDWCKYWTRNYG